VKLTVRSVEDGGSDRLHLGMGTTDTDRRSVDCENRYVIDYTVRRALLFFPDQDSASPGRSRLLLHRTARFDRRLRHGRGAVFTATSRHDRHRLAGFVLSRRRGQDPDFVR
jgi:hypothetical protein